MAKLDLLVSGYLVLVALLCGSFINLAADRIPRGESLVSPRSHCRSCGRLLNVVDLVPVLGWAVRGGRCATCRTPIGVASPVVEAVCGAAMAAALVTFNLWPGGLVGAAVLLAVGAFVTAYAIRSYGVDIGPVRAVRRSGGSPSDTKSASEHLTR